MASPETVAPGGTGSIAITRDTMIFVTEGTLQISTDGGLTEITMPNPWFGAWVIGPDTTVEYRNARHETAIFNYMPS